MIACPHCSHNHRQSTQYRCTECGCFLETGEEWGHGGDWNRRTTSPDHRAAAEEIADWMDENMRAMGGSKTRDIIATILSRRFPRTEISRALGGTVGDRYAEGYAAAREDALAAQPSTAENPNEDSYQRGRFDGIMEYATALSALKPQDGEE